jgi:hypothetical protein
VHTFRVVKEPNGWAIRLNSGMMTPFWSRDLAVQEANCLCDALRGHGVGAKVEIEGVACAEPAKASPGHTRAAKFSVRLRRRAALG